MKIDPTDWGMTPVNPDPNFDPRHNQRVIDEVIKAGEAMASRKQREADDGAKERVSAVTRYVRSVAAGETNSSVEKYFGTQELARLRGREILNRLTHTELGDKLKQKLKHSYQSAKIKPVSD